MTTDDEASPSGHIVLSQTIVSYFLGN